MHYEASGRATPRRRWPIIGPPVLALALVAAALAGKVGESPRPGPDASGVAAATSAAPSGAPDAPDATPAPVRWIECGGIPQHDCGRAIDAAQRALDDPPPRVLSATLSSSLICGDDLDCPRWFLHGSRSVGSVILTFADSPLEAWVNVVEPDPEPAASGAAEQPRGQFLGRVIRWFERS
jgi:hypothetical protein